MLWDADSEQPLGLIGRLKARIVAVTWTGNLSVVAVDELGNVAELESDPNAVGGESVPRGREGFQRRSSFAPRRK